MVEGELSTEMRGREIGLPKPGSFQLSLEKDNI